MVTGPDDDVAMPEPERGADAPDPAEPVADDQRPTVAVLERIAVELADVEKALTRLDDGSYGRCERCQAPIADELLASQPATRLCGAHQRD